MGAFRQGVDVTVEGDGEDRRLQLPGIHFRDELSVAQETQEVHQFSKFVPLILSQDTK